MTTRRNPASVKGQRNKNSDYLSKEGRQKAISSFSDLWNNGSRFRGGFGVILFGLDIHAFPPTPAFLVIRKF